MRRPGLRGARLVAGEYKVDADKEPGGPWFGDYADFLRLRHAQPALRLVDCPDGTPETVLAAVAGASRVVWSDPGSAANRLRVATEELLTAQGVARYRNAKGKRLRIPAGSRIKAFEARKPKPAEALMAVKWIGNEGSHTDDLPLVDVLDGADMLGMALRLLYDTTEAELRRRIRSINKTKGLPRTARKAP